MRRRVNRTRKSLIDHYASGSTGSLVLICQSNSKSILFSVAWRRVFGAELSCALVSASTVPLFLQMGKPMGMFSVSLYRSVSSTMTVDFTMMIRRHLRSIPVRVIERTVLIRSVDHWTHRKSVRRVVFRPRTIVDVPFHRPVRAAYM